nr:egg cell-secreted protein 1.2-like [Ipomoea trifida]
MARANLTCSYLLLLLCAYIVVEPSIAENAILPNGLPLDIPKDIAKCLESITRIPTCLEKISIALLSSQSNANIDRQCCKAALKVGDNCLANVFPFGPFYVTVLKKICESHV